MSNYFDPIDVNLFKLGDLGTLQQRDVSDSILRLSTSLTISGSSEVSASIIDPDFAFAKANYFQIRRDVSYRNLLFEISAVETQRSESIHPVYNIQCRSKGVQLMKRDKKPEAYRGMSGYDFAKTVAERFFLNFVGEKTTKKQSVVKGKSKDSDDSVWTVLQGLASEQQFVAFESEGTLFFCSEKFLLGKWGDPNFSLFGGNFIPFFYPETTDPVFAAARDKYILLEQPNLRRSDDDIRAAEGSMLVDRANGVNLRPGMTIYLGGIPDFESFYIITSVSFEEGVAEPVEVSFRVPVDPTKESVSTKGTKSTTSRSGNSGQPNKIVPPPSQNTPRQGQRLIGPLSTAGADRYTSTALGYINYRGSNGNLIKAAVKKAVQGLINKESLDEITKRLKATAGLTAAEKQHAIDIYVNYAFGSPASTLGVAGGFSPDVIERRQNQFTQQFEQSKSNPTPDQATRTSDASGAPKESESVTLVSGSSNTDKLPGGMEAQINRYLAGVKAKFTAAENKILTDATFQYARFINKSTNKIGAYQTLYNARNTPLTSIKMSVPMLKERYNALRQTSVYKLFDKTIKEGDLPPLRG